jgi:hypothetical protein
MIIFFFIYRPLAKYSILLLQTTLTAFFLRAPPWRAARSCCSDRNTNIANGTVGDKFMFMQKRIWITASITKRWHTNFQFDLLGSTRLAAIKWLSHQNGVFTCQASKITPIYMVGMRIMWFRIRWKTLLFIFTVFRIFTSFSTLITFPFNINIQGWPIEVIDYTYNKDMLL